MIACLALLPLGACGGDDRRERVEAYLQDLNQIQADSKPDVARANRIYAQLAAGRSPLGKDEPKLERSERAIRATRARLAAVQAPADARRLRTLILRYFDAAGGLAHETTELGQYLPAAAAVLRPLNAVNRRLRRGLRRAADPDGQARAMSAYASGVATALRRLRALQPPPVLSAFQRAQAARLRLALTLSRGLVAAIGDRDTTRVARLLTRFKRLTARDRQPGLAAGQLRAYGRRYQALTVAASKVERERRRLEQELD